MTTKPAILAELPDYGKVEPRLVDPDTAERWLALNHGNRKLRKAAVARYAADMAAGDWKLAPDPIQFTLGGRLVNGQHRLHACVQAKTSFWTYVTVIEEADVVAVDTGVPRTVGDLLRWQGEEYALELGATIGHIWRVQRGIPRATQRPTPHQVLAFLKQHPQVRDAVRDAERVEQALKIPHSVAATFLYLARLAAPRATVDEFVDGAVTGANLDEDDPRLALARWCMRRAFDHERPPTFAILAVLIKAWNAWVTGNPTRSVRWVAFGPGAEDFPTLKAVEAER